MIELRAATGYVKHAGAAIAIYKVTGATRSGVQAGGAFFPGVTGLAQDPAVHVALFAFPYNGPAAPPSVIAEDDAGNQRVAAVSVTFLPTRFPKDTIKLTEAFFQRKMPELAPQTKVRFAGLKAPMGSTVWLLSRVTHKLDDGGLTTSAEGETIEAADARKTDEAQSGGGLPADEGAD